MTSSPRPPNDEEPVTYAAVFNWLFSELKEANRRFRTGDDSGRDGVIHAVEAMLKLLTVFLVREKPFSDENVSAPLLVLHNALTALDGGTVQPLLTPARPSGRPRASGLRGSLKGAAAFTVSRLRDAGLSLAEARDAVANVLRKNGVQSDRGKFRKITGRTIRGWCAEVADDVGRHGEAASTFDGLARADPAPNSTGAEAHRLYLGLLENFVRMIGGSKTT